MVNATKTHELQANSTSVSLARWAGKGRDIAMAFLLEIEACRRKC